MSNSDDDSRHGAWMDIGDDGNVKLSNGSLAAANLEPGGRVMVRVVDGVIQLLSHMTLASEIQRVIEKGGDSGPLLKALPGVDGLIVERRLEFLMEERDFHAQHDAAE